MLIGNGRLMLGDCLERMAEIPDASVDLIASDPPYGSTANHWDSIIPLAPMWEQYWRIAKPGAAIVLTATPPFDAIVKVSALEHFKYQWVWEKTAATGFLNAKKQPLRAHELVLVFCKGRTPYNPQMTQGHLIKRVNASYAVNSENYGKQISVRAPYASTSRYPRDVLLFPKDNRLGKPHPTQKPVALFEYLIRTYTQPGDTVLDNCMGSGTTAIAAERSGRRWIGIERDEGYYNAALARIWTECAA